MSEDLSTIIYHKDQISVIMMCIIVFAFFQGLAFYFLFSLPEGAWICLSIALLVGLFFHKLTVKVSNDYLYLAFGIGIIHRKINLQSIEKVEAVQNRWWYGYGIRYTPHGWLWNIQGLDAVELTYTNGKCFRVGTGDVDTLLMVLQKQVMFNNE